MKYLRKYIRKILSEDAYSFMNAMADLQDSGRVPITSGGEIMDMDFLNRFDQSLQNVVNLGMARTISLSTKEYG